MKRDLNPLRLSIRALPIAVLCAGCFAPAHDAEALKDEGDDGRILPCTVVEPGVLYRSGQLDPAALDELSKGIGLKTIVNARGRRDDSSWYKRQVEFARANGIREVDLDVSIAGGPTHEQAQRFLELCRNPANYPILVHCRQGIHRTGHLVDLFERNRHQLPNKGQLPKPQAKVPEARAAGSRSGAAAVGEP